MVFIALRRILVLCPASKSLDTKLPLENTSLPPQFHNHDWSIVVVHIPLAPLSRTWQRQKVLDWMTYFHRMVQNGDDRTKPLPPLQKKRQNPQLGIP